VARARSRLVRERTDPATHVAGSTETFEEFYLREYQAVVGLAYALSGNAWLAEDLAQEAFLAAHRNWSRVAAYERPEAWVRRVAANHSVSAFRRRIVEAKTLLRLARGATPTVAELPPDHAEFWDAVRALPRRRAQVAALYYLEDRPIAEIADVLEMAPGTVKKHLYEARRALARQLGLEEEP
jgi:RNA polymerase sigma-70 factor, ECF subfamily